VISRTHIVTSRTHTWLKRSIVPLTEDTVLQQYLRTSSPVRILASNPGRVCVCAYNRTGVTLTDAPVLVQQPTYNRENPESEKGGGAETPVLM
jgi:hypothetical protein